MKIKNIHWLNIYKIKIGDEAHGKARKIKKR